MGDHNSFLTIQSGNSFCSQSALCRGYRFSGSKVPHRSTCLARKLSLDPDSCERAMQGIAFVKIVQ